jgi:fumarylpyruvate hydrolase
MTTYAFPPSKPVSVQITGQAEQFPVRRIYCVGRNYEAHAKEMGGAGKEMPFFFMKPADAIVLADVAQGATLPYPSMTSNLHHEVELVVAIGKAGSHIPAADALQHVFGYAVGLDMTRRDLQSEMKKQGQPWSIAKGFDHSAPIGPITLAAEVPQIHKAEIALQVNGQERQRSGIDQMIWNVSEIIAALSNAWALQAGDLVFTGTPQGVGPVVRADRIAAQITGLAAIQVQLV